MANTRRNRRGILGTVYSPIHQVFGFGKNGTRAVTRGVQRVLNTGINTVDSVGTAVSSRGNRAIYNLTSGVGKVFTRKSRRGGRRANRKSRRANRRSRRN